MLQALRDKSSGIVAKIVLGALIIVFSFFGIESYFIARTDTWVAKVGKREITPEQFTQRFGDYRQQMQRMMGAQFDGSYFEKPATKRQVLEGLIDEQLMLQANDTLGVVITDQRVQKEIVDIPAFQTNGKFDSAIYRATLSASGKSPTGFQEDVRRDLAARELRDQIAATAFVTPADIDAYVKLRDETRDVDYVTLDKTTAPATAVSDADIETYFKAHAADFAAPEQVSLEYVEIDGSKVKVDSAVDEAAIKERYEKDKTRYVSPEQRLVSHILVKVDKNADADAQKKALAKAQDIAKQAKAAKDFGALAKTASDDLGSKAQGGDLGWIEKGVTDPAFEAALFAMNKGDISEPVLSPEGYHVIDLRDVRAEHARSLEEVRGEITKELQESERERGFNDLATQLTDSVYSNAASLEPTAKKLGLEIQKTPLFTRQGGPGIAGNPAVLKAAFSDAVLVEGSVSDPIDLGQDHKIAVRVAEHKASAPKPLESVKDEVRGKLVTQQSAKASRERADALLKRLRDGESLDKIAEEVKANVEHAPALGRTAANVDSQLTAAVFKMPRPASDTKPAFDAAALANDSYALVALKAVHDGDPSKVDQAGRDQVRQQLQQQNAGLAARAFVQSLRQSTKIEVAEERIQ